MQSELNDSRALPTAAPPREETILEKIKADIESYAKREKSHAGPLFIARLFLLTHGFQFVLARRIQEALYHIPIAGRLFGRFSWWLTCFIFSSELAVACKIGGGLYIPHPYGIVIGRSEIGRNVTILQNVTIGTKGPSDRGWAQIGDDVLLAAGCVVLGPISVGHYSIVGANAVLSQDVPPNSMAVGVPAKILPLSLKPEADRTPEADLR